MTWLDWLPPVLTKRFATTKPGQTAAMGEVAYADPERLFGKLGGVAFAQYNPSKLVTRQGLSIFDEMRLDDQVKAALSFKKHAVLSTGWEIVSPAQRPADWTPTVMIREMFDEMDGSLYEALLGVLTAFEYGFSISEKLYAEDGAQIRLKSLKTRKPHSFEFHADVYGNLEKDGLRQRKDSWGGAGLGGALGEPMPVDKFVLFVNEMEFGNWYGKSELEAAYRPWLVKNHAYRWLAMFLERLGIPPVFALYDPNLYQGGVLSDLRRIFANLQAGTSGIIPRKTKDALEFWTPELAAQVRDVFLPALSRFDQDIARAMLLPQLLGFTSDSEQGSLARSEVHQESFFAIIEYYQGLVADRVMNEQIIRPVCALNFAGLDEFPVFRFRPINKRLRQALMDRWIKAVETGVIIPVAADEAYARELTQFPEREIPEDQAYVVRGAGAQWQPAPGEPTDPKPPTNRENPDPEDEDDDGESRTTRKLSRRGAGTRDECDRLAALMGA